MATIRIPDFISQCPFPLNVHPNADIISTESNNWYRQNFDYFTEVQDHHLSVLLAGKLSAFIHTDASDKHLRASCDLMHIIMFYGDLTDGMDSRSTEATANLMMNTLRFPDTYFHDREVLKLSREPTLARLSRDFWKRCVVDAPPNFQVRFLETIRLFLQARNVQSFHRQNGAVPSLQRYISIRRDSGGLEPIIDFLEYTLQIDLPDHVVEHPVMKALKESVNDFCTWTNDVFSFSKEYTSGDTYNMIIILVRTGGLDLQEAMDYVGDMCSDALRRFCEYEKELPSWGPNIDKDIARYVKGFHNLMSGCLHWSYLSGRYFGKKGSEIENTLIVKLTPPRI